jgi:hypothetical protein
MAPSDCGKGLRVDGAELKPHPPPGDLELAIDSQPKSPSSEDEHTVREDGGRMGAVTSLKHLLRTDRWLFLAMLVVACALIWATRNWHSYLARYAVVVGWGSFICGPVLLWRQRKRGGTGRHSRHDA